MAQENSVGSRKKSLGVDYPEQMVGGRLTKTVAPALQENYRK